MITISLDFRLCGSSDVTVIVVPSTEHVLINLGFLLKVGFRIEILVFVKSADVVTPVVLDS